MESDKIADTLINPTVFDVIIVGGGVAGLTAGLYAARDGHRTLILEGTPLSGTDLPGGALMLTSEIANFPGYLGQSGMELIDSMRSQAEKAGAYIVGERATRLIPAESYGKCNQVLATDEVTYRGRAVIIATGALAKPLNIPGETEMWGRGVSTCATCDGFFFTDKHVAVVGGGDTAVEDALLLTRFASSVRLFVRGSELKASSPEAREILTHPDVTIHWETQLTEVHNNNDEVTHVGWSDKTGSGVTPVHGVFVAIGSTPATEWLSSSGAKLDEDGYVLVENDSTKVLGIPYGVYAAGDVMDKVYRQAVTSAGKAAQAVLEIRSYLSSAPNVC